jgi:putative phosphoribosyl transferase
MFANRTDAGRQLGIALEAFRDEHPVVYGLPRGGVPVAHEVATGLGAPLDVILVRKIGVPGQPELALGAIALGVGPSAAEPIVTWNDALVSELGVSKTQCEALAGEQQIVLDRRARLYRGHRSGLSPAGRTVIVVDDGLATGATARAALEAARQAGARRIVLAVPIAPPETVEALRHQADEVVVLETPEFFPGVGAFYRDFEPTSEDEVMDCLDRGRPATGA